MKKLKLGYWLSRLSKAPEAKSGDFNDYQLLAARLREEMELRVQVALAEARAFTEEQNSATFQRLAERVELRASLASTEAKAYADEGLGAIAKSVGATAKMTLRLSRGLEAREKAALIADSHGKRS